MGRDGIRCFNWKSACDLHWGDPCRETEKLTWSSVKFSDFETRSWYKSLEASKDYFKWVEDPTRDYLNMQEDAFMKQPPIHEDKVPTNPIEIL